MRGVAWAQTGASPETLASGESRKCVCLFTHQSSLHTRDTALSSDSLPVYTLMHVSQISSISAHSRLGRSVNPIASLLEFAQRDNEIIALAGKAALLPLLLAAFAGLAWLLDVNPTSVRVSLVKA